MCQTKISSWREPNPRISLTRKKDLSVFLLCYEILSSWREPNLKFFFNQRCRADLSVSLDARLKNFLHPGGSPIQRFDGNNKKNLSVFLFTIVNLFHLGGSHIHKFRLLPSRNSFIWKNLVFHHLRNL